MPGGISMIVYGLKFVLNLFGDGNNSAFEIQAMGKKDADLYSNI